MCAGVAAHTECLPESAFPLNPSLQPSILCTSLTNSMVTALLQLGQFAHSQLSAQSPTHLNCPALNLPTLTLPLDGSSQHQRNTRSILTHKSRQYLLRISTVYENTAGPIPTGFGASQKRRRCVNDLERPCGITGAYTGGRMPPTSRILESYHSHTEPDNDPPPFFTMRALTPQ